MSRRKTFFYFLSFLEGASVMAAELLGARMLAPCFGSSVYVWSAVLGITLGGLALGYLAGGFFSAKKDAEKRLYAVLLLSSVFLICMPALAKETLLHTAGFSLEVSILVSSFVFLFPSVFFMGMVSPMIVQAVNAAPGGEPGMETGPGKIAGTVFAVSTLGGILSAFLLGFFFIPKFGLTRPAIAMGFALGIVPALRLVFLRNSLALLFFLALAVSVSGTFHRPADGTGVRRLYSGEGLLGQAMVMSYLYPSVPGEQEKEFQRVLFVNRSIQTRITRTDSGNIPIEYVRQIGTLAAAGKKGGKHALLLGLGGGSVANILFDEGFGVDAVELDERMKTIATDFFQLNRKVNVFTDDARHFVQSLIRKSDTVTKYEVVVLDVFQGESSPHHLFTQEFFSEVRMLLSDSGVFFINGNGFWKGETGKGMRSVCKTLLASGFSVRIIPTRKEEEYRNLLFVAAKSSVPAASSPAFPVEASDLDNAVVLQDEKPQLEILNAGANARWRAACRKLLLSGYFSGTDRTMFE